MTSSANVRYTAALLVPALLCALPGDYNSAKEKFARIESDRLPAGTRVELSAAELNAYIAGELPTVTAGVRNPKLEVLGSDLARGSALIDFAMIRSSQGHPPGWLLSKLLEGERPVSVTARIHTAGGQATVDVQKVEISGFPIDGSPLEFLIEHFVTPLYPNAVVGRPFALGHKIDRFDLQQGAVTVFIGR